MNGAVVNLLIGIAAPLGSGLLWSGLLPGRRPRFAKLAQDWLGGAAGGAIYGLLTHGIAYTAGCALSALAAVAYWWWKRRRRDRAPRLLGEKSRALIAALVAKVRESARPRPVLRPVPGGAG